MSWFILYAYQKYDPSMVVRAQRFQELNVPFTFE